MTSASEYASSPISDTPATLARIDVTLDDHHNRLDRLHTRLKELEDVTYKPNPATPAEIVATGRLYSDGRYEFQTHVTSHPLALMRIFIDAARARRDELSRSQALSEAVTLDDQAQTPPRDALRSE